MNYFKIDGIWKDDGSSFSDYIIKDTDDIIEEEDDSIFFYGLSEEKIKNIIIAKNNTPYEFIISSYKKLTKKEVGLLWERL